MRRQVESNAQALLSGSDVIFVEFIALFDGTESGVLADGPRTLREHGRIRSPGVRVFAGKFVLQSDR